MKIIGHRGCMVHAPENTLAAFRRAWEEGADGIELDVHLTRDGRIVVHHDADLRRTAGCPKRLDEMAWFDVQSMDVGAWKGDAWRGERIPTLEDVVRSAPREALVIVEVKCGTDIVPKLLEAQKSGLLTPARIWFVGFDAAVMCAVKRAMPAFMVLLNLEAETYEGVEGAAERWAVRIRESGLDGIGAGMRNPNWSALQHWKRSGLVLFAWVVRDQHVARRLSGMEVDAAAADCPGALRTWQSVEGA